MADEPRKAFEGRGERRWIRDRTARAVINPVPFFCDKRLCRIGLGRSPDGLKTKGHKTRFDCEGGEGNDFDGQRKTAEGRNRL